LKALIKSERIEAMLSDMERGDHRTVVCRQKIDTFGSWRDYIQIHELGEFNADHLHHESTQKKCNSGILSL
jgi:hypothetical protein